MPFKVIFVISFIFSIQNKQAKVWHDKFVNLLTKSDGITMKIEINTKQYDSAYSENGTIAIQNKNKFLFKTNNESILFIDDTIKTWDKNQKKLIIEERIKDDINIFDILLGEVQGLKLVGFISENGMNKINYEVPALGFVGNLILEKNNSAPRSLSIIYDKDYYIELKVNKTIKDKLNIINEFKPFDIEVIDLRE